MRYDVCIEAAGVPVLSYHSDGDYQGTWFAYTARGFYTGSYGSCSGCDWREAKMDEVDYDSPESVRTAIDAGIGREILKAEPMTLGALIASISDAYLDDRSAIEAWARKAVAEKKADS